MQEPTSSPRKTLRVALVQLDYYEENAANPYGEEWERVKKEARGILQEVRREVEQSTHKVNEGDPLAIQLFAQQALQKLDSISDQVASTQSRDPVAQRVGQALRFCRSRNAQVVVFPEFGVPARCLAHVNRLCQELARDGKPLLVVAGAHYHKGGDASAYEALAVPPPNRTGTYAPVFVKNSSGHGCWSLIPKVAPARDDLSAGREWEPSAQGWAPIAFEDAQVAVQVCSDYPPVEWSSPFEEVKGQLNGTQLILVPAWNSGFDDFKSHFISHWRAGRKTVYANIAREGNSLTYCTDKRVGKRILNDHIPFAIGSGSIYRMPMGSEGVMITEVRLGDRDTRDQLIALAPLILEQHHPAYCGMYIEYQGASALDRKRDIVKRFIERDLNSEIRNIRPGAVPTPDLFREKLVEIERSDVSTLGETDLDFLAEVVLIKHHSDRSHRLFARVAREALELAARTISQPRLNDQLIKLARLLRDHVNESKITYAVARKPDDDEGAGGELPGGTREGAFAKKEDASGTRTLAPQTRYVIASYPNVLERFLSVLTVRDYNRILQPSKVKEEAVRLVIDLVASILKEERKSSAERSGLSARTIEVFELLERAQSVLLSSGWIGADTGTTAASHKGRNAFTFAGEEMQKDNPEFHTQRESVDPLQQGASGGSLLWRILRKNKRAVDPYRAVVTVGTGTSGSPNTERKQTDIGLGLTRTGGSTGGDDNYEEDLGRVESERKEIESLLSVRRRIGPATELDTLLALIRTAEDVLCKQLEAAICAFEPTSGTQASGQVDSLHAAGLMLEWLATTIVSAALKQVESGGLDVPGLVAAAVVAIPAVVEGTQVRQWLSRVLRDDLNKLPDPNHLLWFRSYCNQVGEVTRRASNSALDLLRVFENSEATPLQINALQARLLEDVCILHQLLATIEEFLKIHETNGTVT